MPVRIGAVEKMLHVRVSLSPVQCTPFRKT